MKKAAGKKICAIIVAYYPQESFCDHLKSIAEQVDHIIVVDNTPTKDGIDQMNFCDFADDIEVKKNYRNLGVAAALNQGCDLAIAMGFERFVLFDQDSKPVKNMIDTMVDVWETHPEHERVLMCGPKLTLCGCKENADLSKKRWTEVPYLITSGSLLSLKSIHIIGGFAEPLFIDFVDVEYCLRIRKAGFKIIRCNNTTLIHRLGCLQTKKLFSKSLHPTMHPSVRRYYQFRNAILLQKQYALVFPEWCARNFLDLIKILTLIMCFDNQKLDKYKYILKGIVHGFLGKTGRNGERAVRI